MLYALIITRSSPPKVFLGKDVLKYAVTLQENPQSCFATLLKSHFSIGVLLKISCIFSENLSLRTSMGGCFCISIYLTKTVTRNWRHIKLLDIRVVINYTRKYIKFSWMETTNILTLDLYNVQKFMRCC